MITRSTSAMLAPSRTNHAAHRAPVRPASTRNLIDDLMTVARCLLVSVQDLSKSDRQFLYDMLRDDGRFPVTGLRRLLELSRRSGRKAHREKMPELLRAYCIPDDDSMDIVAASIAETQAQGAGDVTVHRFLFDRSESLRIQTAEALTEHMVALRRLLDIVNATPVRQ
jgi:hypothetical protein